MGWTMTYPANNAPGDIHIMPDDEQHEETACCNCKPDAQQNKHGVTYTHHSYDGREGLELAREVLEGLCK